MKSKKMVFDRQQFNKNAPANIKSMLKNHLDVLDGMVVDFSKKQYGIINHYEIDGESFYLYPVYVDWCSDKEQMSLF